MQIDKESTNSLWLEEHPRQAEKDTHSSNYLSKNVSFKINLKKEIQVFCRKNKITWNTLAHSAWGMLINRFSTTDQIVFGSSTGSAHNSLLARTIMPIKSTMSSRLTTKQYLKVIQLQLNKKRTNDKIISSARYLLLMKGKKILSKSTILDRNIFSLVLFIDSKQPTNFSIFFNPSLFSKPSIESIANQFQVILQEIINHYHQKICKLNILTEKEKHLLLSKWSHPTHDSTLPLSSLCVHESFAIQAKKNPNQVAVNDENNNVTYSDIDTFSTYLARHLLKNNIKVGDRICVLMDRTPNLIATMLAIFKVGAIFIPINLKYPRERIEYVLDNSQTNYIITNQQDPYLSKYSTNILTIPADNNKLNLTNIDGYNLPIVTPDHIAYIIYTSGTTGNPKGVMIKHKSLINLANWYRICFNITKQDRASQFASQGFDTFFCETIPFLTVGAKICIVSDTTKLTPSLFFLWLHTQKITLCDLPTAYAQMLFNLSWPMLPHLRIVKIGGESIMHYPENHFSFDIWNTYGPTETTVEATYIKIFDAKTVKNPKHYPPPIGQPIINSEIYVVDKNFSPVPIGIPGELLIGGAGLSPGYWDRPDLTKEKFIDHLFYNDNTSKLYRTGDLVRWLPDGNLEFIGRIDYQVKIRGFRIELSEVEAAISSYPDVKEVIVLAKEDISGEKSLIAYVTPNLDKERYLYQERCLLSLSNDQFIEAITEDVSKNGVALSGISESITKNQLIRIHVKLPGLTELKTLNGHVIWQQDNRCGIAFDLNDHEKSIVDKSINYYLSTHNIMEMVLSASAKRNLRKALRKKLQ